MNRKSEVFGISLGELIGIVLAVALILGTLLFFTKLGDIFFANASKQSTLVTFSTLADEIGRLVASTAQFAFWEKGDTPFFIGDDFVVIGFDRDWDGSRDANQCPWQKNAYKPTACQGSACLCLYDDGDSKPADSARFDSGVLNCVSYPGNVRFLAPYDGKAVDFVGLQREYFAYAPSASYEYLFIYGGSCKWGVDFGVKNLYLEKFYDEQSSITYVFVAESSADTAQRRRQMMFKYGPSEEKVRAALAKQDFRKAHDTSLLFKEEYGNEIDASLLKQISDARCPSGSDAECAGRFREELVFNAQKCTSAAARCRLDAGKCSARCE